MAPEEKQGESGEGTGEESLNHPPFPAVEHLPDDRRRLRINGWVVESRHAPILRSLAREEWEEKLGTSHLPEMVFGESSLSLLHEATGIKLYFNAFDALEGWKKNSLPPVEVPAAEKWKFRRNPSQQVILDYDYTFTTPYCGSEILEPHSEDRIRGVEYRRLERPKAFQRSL